ncbi:hypothetical protein VCHENC02_2338, partial [Vibrio harveyi]
MFPPLSSAESQSQKSLLILDRS